MNNTKTTTITKFLWICFSVVGATGICIFLFRFLLWEEDVFVSIIATILLFIIAVVVVLIGGFILDLKIPEHSKVVLLITLGCLALYLIFDNGEAKLNSLGALYQALNRIQP